MHRGTEPTTTRVGVVQRVKPNHLFYYLIKPLCSIRPSRDKEHQILKILSDVLTCTVPPLRVEPSLLKHPSLKETTSAGKFGSPRGALCAKACHARAFVGAAGVAYVFAVAPRTRPRRRTSCSNCASAPRCTILPCVINGNEVMGDNHLYAIVVLWAFVLGCCAFWCCVQPLLVWCRRRVHGEPVLM